MEGGRGRGRGGQHTNVKTRLCKNWEQTGTCPFNDRCCFAHGEADLQQRVGGYHQGGRGGQGMNGDSSYGGGHDNGYGGGHYGGGYDNGAAAAYSDYASPHHAPPPPPGHAAPQQQPSKAGASNLPLDVWAAQGFPVAGPNGWIMFRTADAGESYFHHPASNQTCWMRPAEWPAQGPLL